MIISSKFKRLASPRCDEAFRTSTWEIRRRQHCRRRTSTPAGAGVGRSWPCGGWPECLARHGRKPRLSGAVAGSQRPPVPTSSAKPPRLWFPGATFKLSLATLALSSFSFLSSSFLPLPPLPPSHILPITSSQKPPWLPASLSWAAAVSLDPRFSNLVPTVPWRQCLEGLGIALFPVRELTICRQCLA